MPEGPQWDAERLNIERWPIDGNIQIRILGPATPRVPDGVFLKIQFNPDLNPTVLTTNEMAPPDLSPREEHLAYIPESPLSYAEAPVQTINVSTPERLTGETQAQAIRRKAINLRWQAAQLEELAQKMEALEAQGLL